MDSKDVDYWLGGGDEANGANWADGGQYLAGAGMDNRIWFGRGGPVVLCGGVQSAGIVVSESEIGDRKKRFERSVEDIARDEGGEDEVADTQCANRISGGGIGMVGGGVGGEFIGGGSGSRIGVKNLYGFCGG